jgi:LmbE family N-acetylglucosaminyl deacetylase
MKKKMNVIVLAPHTDDGELGCGGSIAKLIEDGHTIYYVAFSICEDSLPAGTPPNTLELEVKQAIKKTGIKEENLIIYKFPVCKFFEHRQEILDAIIQLKKKIEPNLIFMPSSFSLHQDHQVVYNEGLRALKHNNCLGYDLPWDTLKFETNHFYILKKEHIESKWASLDCYNSQKWRTYLDEEFVFGLARVRGAQIATIYAEAFETIRSIE